MRANYYVYVNRRKDNGVVFYVGKGTGKRLTAGGKSKSKQWQSINKEAGGHSAEVIYSNLTESEAIEIEERFLLNPPEDWKLTNINIITRVIPLNIKDIEPFVYYDSTSPSGLRWKTSKVNRQAGDVAGTQKARDYWRVNINKRNYACHRLVVLLTSGNLPEDMVVNHKDRNKSNNSVDNLEVITQAENMKHLYGSDFNFIQVTSVLQKCIAGRYNVQVNCYDGSGKVHKKMFSMKKYGILEAFAMGIQYKKAWDKLTFREDRVCGEETTS